MQQCLRLFIERDLLFEQTKCLLRAMSFWWNNDQIDLFQTKQFTESQGPLYPDNSSNRDNYMIK